MFQIIYLTWSCVVSVQPALLVMYPDWESYVKWEQLTKYTFKETHVRRLWNRNAVCLVSGQMTLDF